MRGAGLTRPFLLGKEELILFLCSAICLVILSLELEKMALYLLNSFMSESTKMLYIFLFGERGTCGC